MIDTRFPLSRWQSASTIIELTELADGLARQLLTHHVPPTLGPLYTLTISSTDQCKVLAEALPNFRGSVTDFIASGGPAERMTPAPSIALAGTDFLDTANGHKYGIFGSFERFWGGSDDEQRIVTSIYVKALDAGLSRSGFDIDAASISAAPLFGYDPAVARAALMKHLQLAMMHAMAVPSARLLHALFSLRIASYLNSQSHLGHCRTLRDALVSVLQADRADRAYTGIDLDAVLAAVQSLADARAWARLAERPLSLLRHFVTDSDTWTERQFRDNEALTLGGRWLEYKWSVSRIEVWLIVARSLRHLVSRLRRDGLGSTHARLRRFDHTLEAWRTRDGHFERPSDAALLLEQQRSRARASSLACQRVMLRLSPYNSTASYTQLSHSLSEQVTKFDEYTALLGSARSEAQAASHADRERRVVDDSARLSEDVVAAALVARESIDSMCQMLRDGASPASCLAQGVESWGAVRADLSQRFEHIDSEFRATGRRNKSAAKQIAEVRSQLTEIDCRLRELSDLRIACEVARVLSGRHGPVAERARAAATVLGDAVRSASSSGGLDLSRLSPDVDASIRLLDDLRSKGSGWATSDAAAAPMSGLVDRLKNPAIRAAMDRISGSMGRVGSMPIQNPALQSALSAFEEPAVHVLRCYLVPIVATTHGSSRDVSPWRECIGFLTGEMLNSVAPSGLVIGVEDAERRLGLAPLPGRLCELPVEGEHSTHRRRGEPSLLPHRDIAELCPTLLKIVTEIGETQRLVASVWDQYQSVAKTNMLKGVFGKAGNAAKSLFGRRSD